MSFKYICSQPNLVESLDIIVAYVYVLILLIVLHIEPQQTKL